MPSVDTLLEALVYSMMQIMRAGYFNYFDFIYRFSFVGRRTGDARRGLKGD